MKNPSSINLFTWNQDGSEKTASLLLAMISEGFAHVADFRGSVLLKAPYVFGFPRSANIVELSDNGGEINLSWVNSTEAVVSLSSAKCDPWTMYYRIMRTIRGERIDWDLVVPVEERSQYIQAISLKLAQVRPEPVA